MKEWYSNTFREWKIGKIYRVVNELKITIYDKAASILTLHLVQKKKKDTAAFLILVETESPSFLSGKGEGRLLWEGNIISKNVECYPQSSQQTCHSSICWQLKWFAYSEKAPVSNNTKLQSWQRSMICVCMLGWVGVVFGPTELVFTWAQPYLSECYMMISQAVAYTAALSAMLWITRKRSEL